MELSRIENSITHEPKWIYAVFAIGVLVIFLYVSKKSAGTSQPSSTSQGTTFGGSPLPGETSNADAIANLQSSAQMQLQANKDNLALQKDAQTFQNDLQLKTLASQENLREQGSVFDTGNLLTQAKNASDVALQNLTGTNTANLQNQKAQFDFLYTNNGNGNITSQIAPKAQNRADVLAAYTQAPLDAAAANQIKLGQATTNNTIAISRNQADITNHQTNMNQRNNVVNTVLGGIKKIFHF